MRNAPIEHKYRTITIALYRDRIRNQPHTFRASTSLVLALKPSSARHAAPTSVHCSSVLDSQIDGWDLSNGQVRVTEKLCPPLKACLTGAAAAEHHCSTVELPHEWAIVVIAASWSVRCTALHRGTCSLGDLLNRNPTFLQVNCTYVRFAQASEMSGVN